MTFPYIFRIIKFPSLYWRGNPSDLLTGNASLSANPILYCYNIMWSGKIARKNNFTYKEISKVFKMIQKKSKKYSDRVLGSGNEIAEACAYNNTSYFCRDFRRIFKMTAGAFRKGGIKRCCSPFFIPRKDMKKSSLPVSANCFSVIPDFINVRSF